MQTTKNIVFIGMMGCSKTTTGRDLAKLCNRPFYDSDDEYEKYFNITIHDTFKIFGEPEFRNRESKIIKGFSNFSGAVISLGGGAVLRDENLKLLKENGIIVFLHTKSEVIADRLKKGKPRPLLKEISIQSINDIYDKRINLYKKYADIVVDNSDDTPQETANKIVSLINNGNY